MSFTAGFDLCIEIADRRFQDEARRALAPFLQGFTRGLPVPISAEGGGVMLTGNLELYANGLNVHLVRAADARLDIELSFERSALTLSAPRRDSAGDLRGRFILHGVPITLAKPADPMRAADPLELVVDLTAAESAQLWFASADDERAVTALLERAGARDVRSARDALEDAVARYFASLVSPRLSTPIDEAPDGEDGSLSPLRLAHIELDTRPGPVGVGGVLCIYGTVLRANVGAGDRRAKSQFALAPGQQGALALSEDLFRELIFRPAAFDGLLPAWLTATLGKGFLRDLPDGAFAHLDADERARVESRAADDDKVEAAWGTLLGETHRASYASRLGPVALEALPPDVRRALTDTAVGARATLPRPLGIAAAMNLGDARLVSLAGDLEQGFFRTAGRVLPNMTGIDGDAVFHADSRLRVISAERRDGTRAPTIDIVTDDPVTRSTVHIAPWAVALAFFAGPVGAAIVIALDEFANRKGVSDTDARVKNALRDIAAPDLPSGLGVLASAAVVPDALLIGFVPDAADPAPSLPLPDLPSLTIEVERMTAPGRYGPERTQRFSNHQCLEGEYRFRERDVTTAFVLRARPSRLGSRPAFSWRIGETAISGSGVIDGDGGVRLLYVLDDDGAVLRLANLAGGDDFWVTARCAARDSHGIEAEATTGRLELDGRERTWDDRYTQDLRRCVQGALGRLGRGPTLDPRRLGRGPRGLPPLRELTGPRVTGGR